MSDLYDVVAVSLSSGAERVIAEAQAEGDAEAILRMAIARRGLDEEFYKKVPHVPKPSR